MLIFTFVFIDIFIQQLNNLIQEGDVVIGISGSGNSPNIIKAVQYAKKCGAQTIGFLGFHTGGEIAKITDYKIVVPDNHYGRIEDLHLVLCHLISEGLSQLKNREKIKES